MYTEAEKDIIKDDLRDMFYLHQDLNVVNCHFLSVCGWTLENYTGVWSHPDVSGEHSTEDAVKIQTEDAVKIQKEILRGDVTW